MSTECPVKPMPGQVVVRRDTAETITNAGIFLPDSAGKKKINSGVVLAIGDPTSKDQINPKAYLDDGCRITFSSFGGSEMKVNGELYLVLYFADISTRIDSTAKVEEVK